jgi:NAD+ synthase (glutamine-hydrolysing)
LAAALRNAQYVTATRAPPWLSSSRRAAVAAGVGSHYTPDVSALRIALAQVNVAVGRLQENMEKLFAGVVAAADKGAHLVAFPEMALSGYPIEDLAFDVDFVKQCEVTMEQLARRLGEEGYGSIAVAVGYPTLAVKQDDGSPWRPIAHNSVAVLWGGEVVGRQGKVHLPNYGVFDEVRHFLPGGEKLLLTLHGTNISFAICEDIWQGDDLATEAASTGAQLLLVLNGSPYEVAKASGRMRVLRATASELRGFVAYVNLVGGQDEIIFDGDSLVMDGTGRVIARAPRFEEMCLLVDIELQPRSASPAWTAPSGGHHVVLGESDPPQLTVPLDVHVATERPLLEEIYAALVLATRDYVRKNGNPYVLLAVSGGIDSALTATIAVDALGPDRVLGVSMPSKYSSAHSLDDARELAERTGIAYRCTPIHSMMDSFTALVPASGIAEENLQARLRGLILMTLANEENRFVLATGNKSELAVGYSTLYGDAVGAFAPLRDVPKTQLWELARWRNEQARSRRETPPIPESSISKPPSAELRPGQLDSDTLPAYRELDPVIVGWVESGMTEGEMRIAGMSAAIIPNVLALITAAEFKRRQYPLGPKISARAFGRDWRVPITNSWTGMH